MCYRGHHRNTGTNLSKYYQRAFTLIELMIVVAIIAIIAAIAYPSYQKFVTKSVRSQGKSILVQIATRQENFFLDNKAYAAMMTELGYTADPLHVSREGSEVASTSDKAIYKIQFSSASATAFTVDAIPVAHHAVQDTDCGTLTLSNTGVRSQTGTSSDCW